MEKKTDKGRRISVRLDSESTENLDRMVEESGLNQSKVLNALLKASGHICIVDAQSLAQELYKMNSIIRSKGFNDDVLCLLTSTYNVVMDALYQVVPSAGGDTDHGNSQSN